MIVEVEDMIDEHIRKQCRCNANLCLRRVDGPMIEGCVISAVVKSQVPFNHHELCQASLHLS